MAFLDILGFSQMVQEQEKIRDCLNILEEATGSARKKTNHDIYPADDIKFSMMSDSIVLSIACGSKDQWTPKIKALRYLLSTVEKIQYKAALKNIWIRGGISSGKLLHNGNVFGPGMVKAVAVEKEAEFPRVVVDFRVLADVFSEAKPLNTRRKFLLEMNQSFSCSEYSGKFLYDPIEMNSSGMTFFRLDVPFFVHYMNPLTNQDCASDRLKVYNHLKRNILNAENRSVYSKYKWVAEYIYSFLSTEEVESSPTNWSDL